MYKLEINNGRYIVTGSGDIEISPTLATDDLKNLYRRITFSISPESSSENKVAISSKEITQLFCNALANELNARFEKQNEKIVDKAYENRYNTKLIIGDED